ncbi:MAG: alpha/beta hydrolase [Clostridiales bacterium]|nr:alpha/beta hydrolase [Candidatus Blautia equi]
MVQFWDITIPELSDDEPRRAYVYVPDSYEEGSGQRYPVLYMFDGHNVFFDDHATYGKCWGMKDYMDETETEMIIAAVECNHSPDNGRLMEYSPYTFNDPHFGKIQGKGKLYMDWLVNVFKPEIDENYPTLPDREHTFVAGSSMGGLMSLYAVLKYNRVFSRAAALSPSVWVANGKITNLAAKARLKKDTVIYIDYGEKELANHTGMQYMISHLTSVLINRLVNVTTRIIPGGEHCEASWENQLPFFMNTLTYEMKIVPEMFPEDWREELMAGAEEEE